MGNTPSAAHGSPRQPHGHGHSQNHTGAGSTSTQGSPASIHTHPHEHPSGNAGGGHRRPHPNLRLPMPSRSAHISPQGSNPTSPSGRSGSPRRRKSLELPDLNKLSFTPAALTPAAGVPTTHTHTSHHLAPTTAAAGATSTTSSTSTNTTNISTATSTAAATPTRRWHQSLGGRAASPLAGANALGAMSKLDPAVSARSAPIAMPGTNLRPVQQNEDPNPYFPTTQAQAQAVPLSVPIPIPGREALHSHQNEKKHQNVAGSGIEPPPPPPSVAPTPVPGQEEVNDGLVNVPIAWNGGGKNVYVTGNFADSWKGRIKLHRSTHDFNTILRLPPGQYRLKFIVDDSWRCSKQISTATDDDGTLVNWIEVEPAKTEEELKAEWAMDAKPAVNKEEDDDESQWTNAIPPQLVLYQHIEELPSNFVTQEEYTTYLRSVPYLPNVPAPPMLPRILDKVIVNNEAKRLGLGDPNNGGWQHPPPAGLDDNSILAVPNHVVLNHLTASAIRNGTLGVGTTTRYRKKYITTMFFKPTLADLPPSSTFSDVSTHTPSMTQDDLRGRPITG